MNHLTRLSRLRNRYFFLRHGQSQANVAGVIVSHPEDGVGGYGLTDDGRRQVEASVKQSGLDEQTIIYSSDLARAKQSAEITQSILHTEPIRFEPRLRERGFGQLEMQPTSNYQQVWEQDQTNSTDQTHGVEAINKMMDRVTALITELEKTYDHKTILLVTHGDIIMSLLMAFKGESLRQAHDADYPETGELRELKLRH